MNPAVVAPMAAVAVGLGVVLVIVGMVSRIGGWALLAEAYPCLEPVEGRTRWFSSLGLRRVWWMPVSYGGIAVLTFTPEGLRVALLFPFRLMNPPFFVPWREFARTEVTRVLFARQRTFWFGQTDVRMDVTPKLGNEILQAAREAGRNLG